MFWHEALNFYKEGDLLRPMTHLAEIPEYDQWRSIVERVEAYYRAIEPNGGVEAANQYWQAQYEETRHRSREYERTKDKRKKGHVYLLLAESTGLVKIGATTNLRERIKNLKGQLPFPVELVYSIPTDDIFGLEKQLHEHFKERRKHGEWFRLYKDDGQWIMDTWTEEDDDTSPLDDW